MGDIDVRFYFYSSPEIAIYLGDRGGDDGTRRDRSADLTSYLPVFAKILVEAPQIPVNLVRSTVTTSSLGQLQIIQQQLTTRDNLVRLASKLGVYANEKEKPPIGSIVKDMRSRITFR